MSTNKNIQQLADDLFKGFNPSRPFKSTTDLNITHPVPATQKRGVSHEEDRLQAECFKWARNTFPYTSGCLFAVPNGGKRNKVEAMKLKATGTVAGIPDLLFLWKGRFHAFELKTETGTLSDNQKFVHKVWKFHGVEVRIVRSLEDFQKIFNGII